MLTIHKLVIFHGCMSTKDGARQRREGGLKLNKKNSMNSYLIDALFMKSSLEG